MSTVIGPTWGSVRDVCKSGLMRRLPGSAIAPHRVRPASEDRPMRQHVILSWMFPLFLLPLRPAEQGIVIVGRVTDETMQPVSLASVAVSAAGSGTVTDSTGRYTLALPRLSRGDSIVL